MNPRNFVKAWQLRPHLSAARSDRGPVRTAQAPSYCPELDGGYLASEFERRRYGDGGSRWFGGIEPSALTAWTPALAVCQKEKEKRN